MQHIWYYQGEIRVAGHFYLYINNKSNNTFTTSHLHAEYKTTRHVVCSTRESECHGLSHNCQQAIMIRQALKILGHVQNKY